MKPVIISLYPIEKSIPNYNQFIEAFEIVYYNLSTTENFINDMKNEPFNKAVAIFGSYPGFRPLNGLTDHKLIDSLPKNLKIISLCSAGFDGYDLDYLKSKNIKLSNIPVNKLIAMDVADCALWHVLSGIRKFNNWDQFIKSNSINSNTLKVRDTVRNNYVNINNKLSGFAFGHIYHGNPITSCSNKNCLVLGYGLIGKSVVDRMLVLGMNVNVLVNDKLKYNANTNNGKIKFFSSNIENDINIATKSIDIIIVCLPGGDKTFHCINKKIFDNINNNSIIVNIGRGTCINNNDLKIAIENGKIAHVGLDVFENEPIIEDYFLNESSINENSNIFFTSSITPHLGSSTLNVIQYSTYQCIQNLIDGLKTGNFINIVNN